MNIQMLLRKLSSSIQIKKDSLFDLDVEAKKVILKSMPEPNDDVDRSFYQYQCQKKNYGNILSIIINIVCCPIFYSFLFTHKGNAYNNKVYNTKQAVYILNGMPENIVPESLKNDFSKVEVESRCREYINDDDVIVLKSIWRRHPFEYHFMLKILFKILRYSSLINTYKPDAIITSNEYSFTSSVMTMYCNARGVQHINVMHGEKVFDIRDSFFRFNKCYVWNEFYKNLFIKLRADSNQFVIETPRAISFTQAKKKKSVDYTYYLGNESGAKLVRIIQSMKVLSEKSKAVIRPHPRYTNIHKLTNLASESGVEIEDYANISVEESVLRTRYAISFFSTVLNQAYHNGTDIIIDDITDPIRYVKLQNIDYLMLNVPHMLLSNVIKERFNL